MIHRVLKQHQIKLVSRVDIVILLFFHQDLNQLFPVLLGNFFVVNNRGLEL